MVKLLKRREQTTPIINWFLLWEYQKHSCGFRPKELLEYQLRIYVISLFYLNYSPFKKNCLDYFISIIHDSKTYKTHHRNNYVGH